jgi:hypothetical protein
VAGTTPTLIRLGSVPAVVVGSSLLVVALVVSLGWGDTSALTRSPLGNAAIPFWCLSASLSGTLLLASGWGMLRRQRWARPVAVIFWMAAGLEAGVEAALEARSGQFTFSFIWLMGLAIAVWYFYFKRDVVRYYQELDVTL